MPTVARTGDGDEQVTPLELFFDLVFVFALTQVTAMMAAKPTWEGLAEGMLVLSVLWFGWAAFAWLTNTINPDEGGVRIAIFVTMAALFVGSLAVPQAFGDDAVIFGVAYVVVRAMHVALYAMASRDDPQLRHAIGTLAPTLLASGVLVLVACLVDDGALRYGLWIAALAINVAGPVLGGVEDWRIHPGHFSERHALFVIIALGESIVAAGVGIGGQELDAALAAAAALTIAVTAALWWTYFDIGVHVAERKLKQLQGGERARMARDSFTFIHLLMIAGIILFALGAKKTLEHVHEPLKWEAAVALGGGLALYFAGQIAFRLRNVRSFSRRRTTLMVALLALIPVAHEADALIALAIAAAACWTLIAYELLRYGDARQRYRHTEELPA